MTPASKTQPRTSSRVAGGAGRAARGKAAAAPSEEHVEPEQARPRCGHQQRPADQWPDRDTQRHDTGPARHPSRRPVTTRAATSSHADGAAAATTDPAANPSSPTRIVARGPNPVGDRAAQQEQRGEGEDVGLDHPLQGGLVDAERLRERRQRDVDLRCR
jgi:hypothetical protein